MKIILLMAAQQVVMMLSDALYSTSMNIALMALKLDDTVSTRYMNELTHEN